MDQQTILNLFPDIEAEEYHMLQGIMQKMDDNQQRNFLMIYKGRRKEKTLMLLLTIMGFFGVAGIQRFFLGDIALGIVYFFTAGLCFIGTIVDLININDLTFRYNQKQAYEAAGMMSLMP